MRSLARFTSANHIVKNGNTANPEGAFFVWRRSGKRPVSARSGRTMRGGEVGRTAPHCVGNLHPRYAPAIFLSGSWRSTAGARLFLCSPRFSVLPHLIAAARLPNGGISENRCERQLGLIVGVRPQGSSGDAATCGQACSSLPVFAPIPLALLIGGGQSHPEQSSDGVGTG